ncbi:MAG: zf-HC2 domain-containing protein [Anaeromyxobacter sp.]
MTHHAERDLLLDLAYGELSDADARRVRAHVAGCASCRAELERMQGTRELMRTLPEVPAPERGERVLLAAAREAAEKARAPRGLPRWLFPAVALAATVVVVTAVSLREGHEVAGTMAERSDDLMKPAAPAAAPAAPANDAEARTAPVELRAQKKAEQAREEDHRFAEPPPPAPEPRRAAAKAAPAREPEADREGVVGGVPGSNVGSAAGGAAAAQDGVAEAAQGRVRDRDVLEAGAQAHASPRPGAAPPAPRPAAQPPASGELSAVDDQRPVRSEAAPAARAPVPAAPPAAAAAERKVSKRALADEPAPEVRTFPSCPGESRRELLRDAAGRVRRYVREGEAEGRRVRVELEFDAAGALVSERARDLATGEAVSPRLLPGLPRSAAQVAPDAPPRCGP